MFWQAAAFRADRSDQDIQLINDLGWVPFIGLTSTAIIQTFAIGGIILADKRAEPIVPRWAGYVNIVVALSTFPGSVNSFFKTGPLAWNGLFSFYIPMTVFMIYFVVNTYVVLRAIRNEERHLADVTSDAAHEPDTRQLAARIAELERAQLSS